MQDGQRGEPGYLPERQQTTKELEQARLKGFDKSKRVLNSRRYKQVLRQGKTSKTPLFTMVSLPNEKSAGRLGIIVSKKVSKRAVDRNRLKRLVRESFRSVQGELPKHDCIVIAHKKAVNTDSRTIYNTLARIWQTIAN